jgi:hypothetical protein
LRCAITLTRQLAHADGLSSELAYAAFGRNSDHLVDAERRGGFRRGGAIDRRRFSLFSSCVVALQAGEWDIDVSVRPRSGTDFQHDLPRARVAAVEQTWLPVVSGLNPKASYETSDLPLLQPRGTVMLHEL